MIHKQGQTDRGKTGAKAWPESRGEPGHKLGFGRAGQGIKNPGKPWSGGQLGLAWPWQTGAKAGLVNHFEPGHRPDWPGI